VELRAIVFNRVHPGFLPSSVVLESTSFKCALSLRSSPSITPVYPTKNGLVRFGAVWWFLRYCGAIENIFIKYRPHTAGGSRGFVRRPMKAGKGGKKGGTRRNRKKKKKHSPGSILNCGKKKGGKERRWKKEEIEEGEPGALRNDSMLTIKWDFQYLPGKYYGDIRRSSRRMNPLFSRIISALSVNRFSL